MSKQYISQDLYFMILKTLSVKTLMRFRCVCKSWEELIDSKPFILEHLAFQKPRIIVDDRGATYPSRDMLEDFTDLIKFIQYEPETLTLLSSDELAGPNKVQIEHAISNCPISEILRKKWCINRVVGTVDGVICFGDFKTCFLLWNPSIRRLLALPIPEISICRNHKFSGFWIDPSKNYFKVVVFSLEENTIALFSSRKRAWTKVDIEPFVIGNYRRESTNPQILVENVGHWMAYDHPYPTKRGAVFCFDFRKEKFGLFNFPKLQGIDEYGVNYPCLMKWHGFVSIADLRRISSTRFFGCDLWAMQNGTWNKMLSFNFATNCIDRVLHVMEDNRKVLVWSKYDRFGSYDSQKGHHIDLAKGRWKSFEYDFVESLVFPNEKWFSS